MPTGQQRVTCLLDLPQEPRGTALVGMKQVEHVRDNLTVARHAPLHPDQFTKLFT